MKNIRLMKKIKESKENKKSLEKPRDKTNNKESLIMTKE